MLCLNVIIIKNNDILFDSNSNNKPHLAIFRYKKENKDEIRNADAQTLERLKNNLETDMSYNSQFSARMIIRVCQNKTYLRN